MSFQPISETQRERIASAPPDVSNACLAEELGIGESTVRKYRRQAREERREVAREVLERRVEAEMPNALEALGEALKTAQQCMRQDPTPQWVRETRESAKTLLEYVGKPDDRDLDAAIETELEKLAACGERAVSPASPGAAGAGRAAVH